LIAGHEAFLSCLRWNIFNIIEHGYEMPIRTKLFLGFVGCMFLCNALYAASNYPPYYKGQYASATIAAEENKTTAGNANNSAENSKRKAPRFYAGFSVGYVAYLNGGMNADYASQPSSWAAPGSFQESAFQIDKRSMPIQLSIGMNIIENLRLDISHLRYSRISMPGLIQTATGGRNGQDGYFTFHATGGEVSGNATMLGAYYDLNRLIGKFIGGKLSPYVGAGIGYGTNEISDYEIFDNTGGGYYSFDAGITGASNIRAIHLGGSRSNLVYAIEAGGTAELSRMFLLDIFVRYMGLGGVETKGEIIVNQTAWSGGAPANNETLRYKGWKEIGILSILDIGVRLKLRF
jgi:opacity protein-like surface antigen